METFPSLIVDRSQDRFGLVVGSGRQQGKLVDLILDEEPRKPVRCHVAWIGEPGSEQEGCAGLQPSKPGFCLAQRRSPLASAARPVLLIKTDRTNGNAESVPSTNQFLRYRLECVSAPQRHGRVVRGQSI